MAPAIPPTPQGAHVTAIPSIPTTTRPADGALASLAAGFLDDLRGVRADLTVEAYRDELVAIVRDAAALGLPPEPAVWTERDIAALRDLWGGLAPKSIHKRAAVLASFLSFNGNDVVLGMRRRGRLRLPPATRGPVRLTDPAARARLFERASPTQRMAMFLGFGLGLRLREICGVRLCDLQGGDLLVRRAKGGGTRAVPLSGPIEGEVRAYVEGHRASLIAWARLQGRAAEDPGTLLVHVHRGEPRPYTPDGLGDSLRDLGASVGVRFSPHDMRRTFATELAERSVGLEVIQVALGHEMLETTRDYVQVRERRLREAMAVHQGLVLAEMGPRPV